MSKLPERQEGHPACKKHGGWWRWALLTCIVVCTCVCCSDKLDDDEEFEVVGDVSEALQADKTRETAANGDRLCTNDGLTSSLLTLIEQLLCWVYSTYVVK